MRRPALVSTRYMRFDAPIEIVVTASTVRLGSTDPRSASVSASRSISGDDAPLGGRSVLTEVPPVTVAVGREDAGRDPLDVCLVRAVDDAAEPGLPVHRLQRRQVRHPLGAVDLHRPVDDTRDGL